jgi:hypothetical protein
MKLAINIQLTFPFVSNIKIAEQDILLATWPLASGADLKGQTLDL